jgi:hypothetical protein
MKINQETTKVTKLIAITLVAWLALVFFLGARGAFTSPPGSPPLPIFAGVVVPIGLFLIFFKSSHAFRGFVLEFDLRLATGIQAWRFLGLGFLALYVNGVLPAEFSWSAGLGDVAVGATAPWMTQALIRRPGFAASKLFIVWNLFGILDLVAAVSSGALSALLARGVPGEITTGPMAQLPLALIPTYLVPIFVMLHLAALFQTRRPPTAPKVD